MMESIFCKLFGVLKYVLLVVSFGFVFYGIIVTYNRLEKPLSDAISVFLPFAVVLLIFILNLIFRSKYVNENLLFNFVSCMLFFVIIFICLRAMFDTNMMLYHRYNINFNPSFFSDNLSMIEMSLYMISVSNIFLLICNFIDKHVKN